MIWRSVDKHLWVKKVGMNIALKVGMNSIIALNIMLTWLTSPLVRTGKDEVWIELPKKFNCKNVGMKKVNIFAFENSTLTHTFTHKC